MDNITPPTCKPVREDLARPVPLADQINHRDNFKNFLVSLIKERDHVSFVEIKRFGREAGFNVDGDRSATWDTDLNLILWNGISGELLAAINSLLADKVIFMQPASYFTYFADGEVLNLPVAKRPPAGGYKRPRWLPVVFRVVPF